MGYIEEYESRPDNSSGKIKGDSKNMGITKMLWSTNKKKTEVNKTKDAVKPAEVRAVLDHPQQGEKITSPQYTFRIGTLGDIELVAISINNGPWQPCRNAAGYWWYDWAGYKGGQYQAEAKAQTKDGQVFTSETRKFQVVLGTEGKQLKVPKTKP